MMKKQDMNRSLIFTLLACLLLAGSASAGAPAAHDTTAAQPTGSVLYLDGVVFSGIDIIPEEILRGALSISPGDTLTVAALARARQDVLYSHHLVRDVRVSTRPGSRLGYVTVEMEIDERGRVAFETGFGYHDIYGWFVTVAGIKWQPVKGSDSMWRAGVRLGFHLSGIDADWEKPGLLDTGAGAGARFWAYNQTHLFYASAEEGLEQYEQDISRVGAELFLLYRQKRRTRLTFGMRIEGVDPDSTFKARDSGDDISGSELPESMAPDVKKTTITGFQFRLIRDTRDLFLWPRSGTYTNLSIQTNTELLGSDAIFTKAELDSRFYKGFGGWRAVSGRLKAGIATTGTPYYDKFFIGGGYSVRGFRELSLSPPRGHDAYWLAGLELRAPLIPSGSRPPRLTGLLFADAGQGWVRDEAGYYNDVQAAVGYGIRLRLPWLGLIGFDAGIPVTDGTTGDPFWLHLGIGFSF
jgi:outer membrane protein assembly factor BamA